MPTFSPALITIMRGVLEEAMTKVPAEQATTVTKAYLAEFILKAAAEGRSSVGSPPSLRRSLRARRRALSYLVVREEF